MPNESADHICKTDNTTLKLTKKKTYNKAQLISQWKPIYGFYPSNTATIRQHVLLVCNFQLPLTSSSLESQDHLRTGPVNESQID